MDLDYEKITETTIELPDLSNLTEVKECDKDLGVIIGKAILGLLKKKGITQQELANSSFVSTSMMSKIVLGKTKPSIDTLYLIAEHLEVSLDYLCGRTYVIAYNKKTPDNSR